MKPQLPCRLCLTQTICVSKYSCTISTDENSRTYFLADVIMDFCPKIKRYILRNHKYITDDEKIKDLLECFNANTYFITNTKLNLVEVRMHHRKYNRKQK